MTPERWQQVEAVFLAAADRPAGERTAYLDQACAGDPDLRNEVEAMLRHEATGLHFFEEPVQASADLIHRRGHSLEAGDRILHYEIRSRISVGGMGEVYLAWDPEKRQNIVIKLLRRLFAFDPQAVLRFTTEARAAGALRHPNIVEVYESGVTELGHFIAMEWVDGDTMRTILDAGLLDLPAARDASLQTAEALRVAHAAGIVHRDIKPENIMRRTDGVIKVLDFGLARVGPSAAADPERMGADGTISGTLSGTLSYLAPELLLGHPSTSASDIFSLGSFLYEVATGCHPFAGETPLDIYEAIERRSVRPPAELRPELGAAWSDLLLRMLLREVEQRPTAAAVVQALRKLDTL